MLAAMTIQTELTDGTICRVVPKGLELLLGHQRVKRFRRRDGWVVVGRDPLRSASGDSSYDGPERRCFF